MNLKTFWLGPKGLFLTKESYINFVKKFIFVILQEKFNAISTKSL